MALVGVDGSGKTTVAQQLVASAPWPCRYLYMGQSLGSSNLVLPTSAAARALRQRSVGGRGRTGPAASASGAPWARRRERVKYPWLRSAAAMANRVVEAWWRGRLAAGDRRRGVVIVYDRYMPLEATIALADPGRQRVHGLDRLERWCVERVVPRPDLVIHLEVTGEVAVARKGESSAIRLERWRRVIGDWGSARDECVSVDACQPMAEVLADVASLVETLRAG